MKRIPPFRSLDALRGLAAAWVVMRHASATFVAGPNLHFAHEPLYFVALRGQLGVMLFFLISGYCITAAAYAALLAGKPLRRYAFDRVRRIYPPYLAALILTAATILALGFVSAHHWIAPINHPHFLGTSVVYWIGNLFLLQSEFHVEVVNAVFWSLSYEIAFYAVVGVMLWTARRIAARHGLAPAALALFLQLAASTCLSVLSLILLHGAWFPFDLWHMFALGGILFFVLEAQPGTFPGYSRRIRWLLNASAVSLFALTTLSVLLHPNDDAWIADPHTRISSAAVLLFFLLLIALRRVDRSLGNSRWLRPFLWLGACSYSLYLTHTVILPFVSVLTRRVGLNGNLYWISFWIQVAAAILFGRLFYLLVERHFISSRQRKRLLEEHAG